MALIVHKYGGTSMGSTERIRNVAKRVAKWARAGHQMVVVPSAMSGETNRLLGLASELAPNHPKTSYYRELDMLAATGEQASSALLAIALQAEGMESVSYAGWQVPVRTDSSFTKARIESIDDKRVRADLSRPCRDRHRLPGIDPKATSPRWVVAARILRPWPWLRPEGCRMPDLYRCGWRLHHRPPCGACCQAPGYVSFEEMLEMASLGSKVLQIRSVEFAGKYKVPMRVLSSFTPGISIWKKRPSPAR
jgi:aspartate kinase